jgi:hypothetical protein
MTRFGKVIQGEDDFLPVIFSYDFLPFGGCSVFHRGSISNPHIFHEIKNDFVYPLVYMQDKAKYTVHLGIMFLNGRY